MTDYERIFSAPDLGPEHLRARMVEAMSSVRNAADPALPRPVVDVSTGVAAPATIGFVLWVARRAQELGLERLYFAGRNGRLAEIVYNELPRSITGGIDATYIRISRNVVRRASAGVDLESWINCGHATATSFLRQHANRLPLRRLVERAVLNPDDHADALHRLGLRLDQPLPIDADREWRAFFDDAGVRAAIQHAADDSLPILEGWLHGHGMFDHTKVGLVDVGWRGQQAAMIDAVVGRRSVTRIQHFHLGRNVEEPLLAPSEIERYLIDIDRPLVRNPVALFETLMATSEQALVDLERTPDGAVAPILRDGLDPVGQSPHIVPLQKLVAEVTSLLAPTLTPADLEVDLREPIGAVTERFWEHPTITEARWWAAVPFEQDGSGQLISVLGTPVSIVELPRIAVQRSLGTRQWTPGALMASGPLVRRLLMPIQRRLANPSRARSEGGTSVSNRG